MVFEIVIADGLETGPSANRGFFLKKPVPRAPGKGRRQRLFFYFFEKTCAESPGPKAVGKDAFLF
jgi:hypothetical protein